MESVKKKFGFGCMRLPMKGCEVDAEEFEKMVDSFLENGFNYFDPLLIYQPFGDYYGTYRAMEEAYKEGTVRALGVSNFYPDRFLLQSDVVLIPKYTHKNRIEENFSIFDFALDAGDMKEIEALDTGESLFFTHYDLETVEWFMTMV